MLNYDVLELQNSRETVREEMLLYCSYRGMGWSMLRTYVLRFRPLLSPSQMVWVGILPCTVRVYT